MVEGHRNQSFWAKRLSRIFHVRVIRIVDGHSLVVPPVTRYEPPGRSPVVVELQIPDSLL